MALKIIKNLKLVNRRVWENFVSAHPEGNVFQMPWMYDIYEQARQHKPVAFFAFEGEELIGLVVAVHLQNLVFPMSFFTRRQVVVGGPLVKGNDIGVLLTLLEALVDSNGIKKVFTEIRNLRLGLSLKPVFEEAGFFYESYLSVVVDMRRKSGEIWESLSPERKENILKMKTGNYTISDLDTLEEICDAWRIVRCSIGRKGRPVPHQSLFVAGHNSDSLKRHKKVKGLLVKDKLKAMIMVLTFKHRAYIYFEGNCLDPKDNWMYDGFMWAVIQELQSEGIQFLNLGAGGRPGKDFLARQYKKSYGGMIKETGRYIYIHNWVCWNLGRVFYRWYKRMRIIIFRNFCKL
jgi:serine/alanine adding enzyme